MKSSKKKYILTASIISVAMIVIVATINEGSIMHVTNREQGEESEIPNVNVQPGKGTPTTITDDITKSNVDPYYFFDSSYDYFLDRSKKLTRFASLDKVQTIQELTLSNGKSLALVTPDVIVETEGSISEIDGCRAPTVSSYSVFLKYEEKFVEVGKIGIPNKILGEWPATNQFYTTDESAFFEHSPLRVIAPNYIAVIDYSRINEIEGSEPNCIFPHRSLMYRLYNEDYLGVDSYVPEINRTNSTGFYNIFSPSSKVPDKADPFDLFCSLIGCG